TGFTECQMQRLITAQAPSSTELGVEPRSSERRVRCINSLIEQWSQELHGRRSGAQPDGFSGSEQPRRKPGLPRAGSVRAQHIKEIELCHPVVDLARVLQSFS